MEDDELAAVGLAPPRVAITVWGAEEEGGDEVVLAEIDFGVVEDDGRIVARPRQGGPVYRLDAAVAEKVPVSAEAFRNRFLELAGSDASFVALAPAILFRAIGDKLPHGLAEGAAVWALAQMAAQRSPDSIRRAGFEGSGPSTLRRSAGPRSTPPCAAILSSESFTSWAIFL